MITIHTMASVDLRAFNTEFMQHYLLRCQGITDHQKSDMLKAFQNQEVPSLTSALLHWCLPSFVCFLILYLKQTISLSCTTHFKNLLPIQFLWIALTIL